MGVIRYAPGASFDPSTGVLALRVRAVADALGLDVLGMEDREVADLLFENLVWGSNPDEITYETTNAEGGER